MEEKISKLAKRGEEEQVKLGERSIHPSDPHTKSAFAVSHHLLQDF